MFKLPSLFVLAAVAITKCHAHGAYHNVFQTGVSVTDPNEFPWSLVGYVELGSNRNFGIPEETDSSTKRRSFESSAILLNPDTILSYHTHGVTWRTGVVQFDAANEAAGTMPEGTKESYSRPFEAQMHHPFLPSPFLVRLNGSLNDIPTAKIPARSSSVTEARDDGCIVVGWNTTEGESIQHSATLVKTEVKILADADCQAKLMDFGMPSSDIDYRYLICTEPKEGEQTCPYPMGSLLVCNSNEVMGVFAGVPVINACGSGRMWPHMFLELGGIREWIQAGCRNCLDETS